MPDPSGIGRCATGVCGFGGYWIGGWQHECDVGGQTLLPNTTLFSGDSLQVKDGVAVVALGSASRMVFGRDTVASFLRDSNEVTVLLGQGKVSVFHAEDALGVRVKVGDVSVVPVSGFRTLGEVATLNGAMVVTTKEGILRVEGNGQVINVAKGKTITVHPSASAPQLSNPPSGRHISGATVWGVAGTGVGGAGLIVAAFAMSRAGTAKDNANSASSAAASGNLGRQCGSVGCRCGSIGCGRPRKRRWLRVEQTCESTDTTSCQSVHTAYGPELPLGNSRAGLSGFSSLGRS